MNLRIALLSTIFIAPCAFAMDKEKQATPPNSGWFRFSGDMCNDEQPKAPAPQQPAPSSNWGWFRTLDHEEPQPVAQKAKAQVVTASWLRTRDTNEE